MVSPALTALPYGSVTPGTEDSDMTPRLPRPTPRPFRLPAALLCAALAAGPAAALEPAGRAAPEGTAAALPALAGLPGTDPRAYRAHGTDSPLAHPPATRSVGVQIERNETGVRLGNLSFPFLFEALYKRHGEAAAYILDRSADSAAGRDIPVFNLSNGFFDFPTGAFRQVVERADVVSLSQTAPIRRTEAGAFAGAGAAYASSAGIEVLRALWAGTDTAVFHAIGNDRADAGLIYPEANLNWIFNDLYIRVGRGRITPDGQVQVHPNSPANAVSVIAEIPDYHYRLFSDPAEALERTYRYLERNRDFYESALIRAVSQNQVSPFNLGYCAGRSRFDAPFAGRDLLDRPTYAQISTPLPDLFRAYSTCAAETLRDRYASRGREPATAYNLHRIGGTSFATPAAAGLFLALHERHPGLGKHDLLAALILSARPAESVGGSPGTADRAIAPRRNGRGLPHTPEAGFGFVDAAGFEAAADRLATLAAARPDLATAEHDTVSEITRYATAPEPDAAGRRSYPIRVTENPLFVRGVLVMSFGDGNRDVPAEVTLTGPRGATVTLAPGRYEDGSLLVLAGTDAFFGTPAAGTWRLGVPEGYSVEAAGLSIEGVAGGPGSLIDTFLGQEGHPAADTLEIATRPTP